MLWAGQMLALMAATLGRFDVARAVAVSAANIAAGPATLTYSTAKAAAIHLTRCAAVELGEDGIRVKSVSPRPVVTGIFGKDQRRLLFLLRRKVCRTLPWRAKSSVLKRLWPGRQ